MKQFAFFKRWRVLLILAGLILVATQGISLAASQEGPLIYLQYAQFDPLKSAPNIPEAQPAQIESSAPGTYLLQFSGPVQDEWKTALQAEGVRLYEYVPDYAFIARMDGR